MGKVLVDALPPTERVLFESDVVVIGQVRCPPDASHFRDCGSVRTYCAIFPRSAVMIRRRNRRAFIEDPTVVGFYNRGEEYERFEVSPEGDRGDWFAFAPSLIREAIGAIDPAAGDADQPMRIAWAVASARTFLQQRRIFEHVRRAAAPDRLQVEEQCLRLLDRIIAEAYGSAEPAVRTTAHDLAEAVCHIVDRRFADPLTLGAVAKAVGTSPFRLCRAFRQARGTSIHRYVRRVRLRRALECLGRHDVDLGHLAIHVGFSSHSHFSEAFRREFLITPSECRRRIAEASAP